MTRHFLRDDDISAAEQREIIDLALRLKQEPKLAQPFAGPKTVALIFDKHSTRTRVSFTVGVADFGGFPLVMDTGFSQLGSKETPADTARVLDRQVAMIVWRTYAQSGLDEMAAHSRVPVINSLSDDFHPCQLLADVLTIREHFGETCGLKVAFIGDGSSNTAQSFLLAAPLAGMSITLATPPEFAPNPAVLARAKQLASENSATVEVIADPAAAARKADVVATDTWVSMGQEEDKVRRLKAFASYTVTPELMAHAKPSAIFLHCLPADRGFEVAAEVIDGPQSKIWDEAENRLHAQKALMLFLTRN